jgi:starvation-inducible outer membrane lipoprotein
MQIRKSKRVTSYQCSEVADLDPEKFRNLSVPFTGETEEEFMEYISQNSYELEEIYSEFDEETWSEFEKILQPEWVEYNNSEYKYEDSWYEAGNVDESFTKSGGFEVIHSTDEQY